MVLPTQQEHKLFAEGRGRKCHHTYILLQDPMQSHACSFFQGFRELWSRSCWYRNLPLPSWINLCWRVVSWVSCMSQRRTCPQTRSMGQIQLNNVSPGAAGTSWLPTALETLQKLKQWTLQSCLIQPRNERETLPRRGWSHCACSFCTKDSYIQGLTYSSFSFSKYESGCTCYGSFVVLKTNTFPTTFNLQSCNRYRGLLCPLCWPWPLQDDVKTGEDWEEKNGSDSCIWTKWTNSFPNTTEKCYQTFSKHLNFYFK